MAHGEGHLRQLLGAGDGHSLAAQLVQNYVRACFQKSLDPAGIVAGSHQAHTSVEHSLEKHGSGGCAVTFLVLQTPKQFAHKHGPYVGPIIRQLDDALGNHPAVVQQLRSTVVQEPVDGHDARHRSQGGTNGIDNLVGASYETAVGGGLEDRWKTFVVRHARSRFLIL